MTAATDNDLRTADENLSCVRMGLIYKLSELTADAFSDHWRGPHGTHASRMPGLRRYHQNHVKQALVTGGIDRWELSGLSELWFDDIPAMRRAIASQEYEAVATDTPNVMTVPGIIAGYQRAIAGLPHADRAQPKAMIVLGLRRKTESEPASDDLSAAAGRLHELPGAIAGRLTIVTVREGDPGVDIDYDKLPIDAVIELWFETEEQSRTVFASHNAEYVRPLLAIAPELAAYTVATHVVVP